MSSPQFRLMEHRSRVQLLHSWPDDTINFGVLIRELERNREMQNELQDCIAEYQVRLVADALYVFIVSRLIGSLMDKCGVVAC